MGGDERDNVSRKDIRTSDWYGKMPYVGERPTGKLTLDAAKKLVDDLRVRLRSELTNKVDDDQWDKISSSTVKEAFQRACGGNTGSVDIRDGGRTFRVNFSKMRCECDGKT